MWWNELWRTYVQGQTSADGSPAEQAPPQIAKARQTVVDHLARLARTRPKDWIAVDDLVDGLHDRNDEFLLGGESIKDEDRGYSYTYRNYGSRYHDNPLGWVMVHHGANSEAAWNGVERVFIEAVLTEGLYWLGLLDLGYASDVTPQGGAAPNKPLAVRLTDMGRWLLLQEAPPAVPEETGRVVVQPNFHIFAFDPISDAVLARLDTFAVRLNAERAIEYVVSRESVYRAQLAGQTTGEIQGWLEQTTGAALPQNVARSLTEWQSDFERIVIRGRVGWLETTPEQADALLDNPTLRPAIVKRISPTGLLVRASRMDALEQALLAAGELPRAQRRSGQRAPRQRHPGRGWPHRLRASKPQHLRLRPATGHQRANGRGLAGHARPASAGRARPAWTRPRSSPRWRPWLWAACRPPCSSKSRPGPATTARPAYRP